MEIQVFPNKQLGDKETDLISMVRQGVVGAAVITCGPITTFDPMYGVMDLPFLFTSEAQAYKVLDDPIGRRFLDSLSMVGIKGLAFGERGFRNVSNNVRPIQKPEDLKKPRCSSRHARQYLSSRRPNGNDGAALTFQISRRRSCIPTRDANRSGPLPPGFCLPPPPPPWPCQCCRTRRTIRWP